MRMIRSLWSLHTIPPFRNKVHLQMTGTSFDWNPTPALPSNCRYSWPFHHEHSTNLRVHALARIPIHASWYFSSQILLSTPTHLWSLCKYIVLLLLAGGSIRLRGSALLERGRGLRWGWIRHQRRQGARAWVVTSSYSTFIVFIFLFVPPEGVNQCENLRLGAQFPRKCVILI